MTNHPDEPGWLVDLRDRIRHPEIERDAIFKYPEGLASEFKRKQKRAEVHRAPTTRRKPTNGDASPK